MHSYSGTNVDVSSQIFFFAHTCYICVVLVPTMCPQTCYMYVSLDLVYVSSYLLYMSSYLPDVCVLRPSICVLIPTIYVPIPTRCMCPQTCYMYPHIAGRTAIRPLFQSVCALIPTIYVSSFLLYMYLIPQVTLQFLHYFGLYVSLDLVYVSSYLLYICVRIPQVGLKFVHQLGLIHCDLKPENVLVLSLPLPLPPSLPPSLPFALSLPLARSLSRCAYIPRTCWYTSPCAIYVCPHTTLCYTCVS